METTYPERSVGRVLAITERRFLGAFRGGAACSRPGMADRVEKPLQMTESALY